MRCLLKKKEDKPSYSIPVVSKKQMQTLETNIVKNAIGKIQSEVDIQMREREYQAGTRAECMVFVALIREFGFGKKRLYRVWRQMESMLEELSHLKDWDVMDETLFVTLENVGMDTKKIFKEYFEAEENRKKRMKRENEFLEEHKEYVS